MTCNKVDCNMWVYKRLSCRVIHGQMSFFKKKNINVYVQYVRFYNLLSCRVIHGQMAPQDIRYILRSEPRHGDIFFSFIFTNLHQFTEPHHGDIFLSLIFTIFFLLFYTNFLSRATVTYFSPFFSLIHTYFFFVFSPISHSFTPIYWATPQWHIFIINFLTHLHQFSEPLHGHIFFSYLFTICLNYVHQFSFQSVSIFSVRDAQFALWEMYNFLLKKYTIFASPGFLEIDPPPYQGPAPLPTVPLAVEQFTQVLIRMIVVLMRKLWIPTRKK